MTTFIDTIGITGADPNEAARPGQDSGMALRTVDEHANSSGGVHGGVLATMLDTTMGDAVRVGLDDDQATVTVSLTVTYLDSANIGDELRSSAEVRRRGGKLVLVEGDITRASDGAAIAHGVATFTVVSKS